MSNVLKRKAEFVKYVSRQQLVKLNINSTTNCIGRVIDENEKTYLDGNGVPAGSELKLYCKCQNGYCIKKFFYNGKEYYHTDSIIVPSVDEITIQIEEIESVTTIELLNETEAPVTIPLKCYYLDKVNKSEVYLNDDLLNTYSYSKDTKTLSIELPVGQSTLKICGGSIKFYNEIFQTEANAKYITSVNIGYNISEGYLIGFNGAINMTSITIPDYIKTFGSYLFRNTNLPSLPYFPNNLEYIYSQVYYNNTYPEIIIPNTVKELGSSCFANNNYLTSMTIPENIENVGMQILANCGGLENLYVKTKNSSVKASNFNGSWVKYCNENLKVYTSLSLEESLQAYGKYWYYIEQYTKATIYPNYNFNEG